MQRQSNKTRTSGPWGVIGASLQRPDQRDRAVRRLRAYEQDIEKLQVRLREARSRQTAIAARLESAENRVKLRSLMTNERTDEALARFDQLERRVDYAEGRADALSIADGTGKPTLADEIAALAGKDQIDDELAEMKRALGMDDKAGNGDKE